MLFWIIVSMFIFGALGTLIGERKGRGLSGALWGALLGPIGLLIIAVVPDARSDADKGLRTCPQCAEAIKAEAKVCRFCSADLEPA